MTTQPVPSDLIDLSNAICESQNGEEKAASNLMTLHGRVCNLLATSQAVSVRDPVCTVSEALALDEELKAWSRNLPPGFEITQQESTPSTKAYDDHFEIHTTIFSAEIWTLLRSARLGVNGIIVCMYSAILATRQPVREGVGQDLGTPNEYRTSRIESQLQERVNTIEALRADMCAAVPFLLDRHLEPHAPELKHLPLCNRTPVVNFLMFFTKSPGVSDSMFIWATELLAELQADQDVDNGAIWMNRSFTY